jgi:ankyrin repeat protein
LVGRGKGVNVNARNQKDEKKKTAILSACSRGYADIVELLLDNGADGMIKANDTETTAMHHAAKGGNVEVGRLLLKRGYKADEEAIAKWQPIHYASLHAKIDMIDLLLDKFAFVCSTL